LSDMGEDGLGLLSALGIEQAPSDPRSAE